jgi:hypothetical protein
MEYKERSMVKSLPCDTVTEIVKNSDSDAHENVDIADDDDICEN